MTCTIQNEQIRIAVATKGAELQRIQDIQNGQQYMWNADPKFWAKHSPILFPIVGALKGDAYWYEGEKYQLSRHGFARDMEFELFQQTENTLVFLLRSDEATLKKYPFKFELYLSYFLTENGLEVNYKVKNVGEKMMYFSIGGHPAFKVPLFDGDAYEDYILEFNQDEDAGRWLLDNGLLKTSTEPLMQQTSKLPLNKGLFDTDAIVLKHLKSDSVRLLSQKTKKGFEFNFAGFPYLGIWAAKDADFVCIEPWCGIADNVDSKQQLIEKEGINELMPDETFERTWRFSVIN